MGTISATGIYTAPTVIPVPNTVAVVATSTQSPSQSASASVTIAASTGNAIAISSLDSTSTAPFALLTITGSGFDNTAPLQVTFFNDSGFAVTVPVLLATSTMATVSVPPVLDGNGNPSSGMVNVEVAQLSSLGTTSYSNVLSGFQVRRWLQPLPPGTLTLLFSKPRFRAQ